MEILPVILNRTSTREFSDKPIDKETLERVLEAGRLAPSFKNRQPWRFIVVKDQDLRKKIQEAAYNEPWIGQAPAILALCTTNIDGKMPNGLFSYSIDLAFPAAYMTLQAQNEGLGSCINTTFDQAQVRDILTVPYSMQVVMLLILGYPAKPMQEDPHHDRHAKKRIISVDHW